MYKKNVKAYFGLDTITADIVGLTSAGVSQWKTIIPEKQAIKLEYITKGELKYDPSLYKGPPKIYKKEKCGCEHGKRSMERWMNELKERDGT